MQSPGETAEGITRPPHYASYSGDFYRLKAAGACVYDCGHITVSLWQSGLWEQTLSSVSARKEVCPGSASCGGICMLVHRHSCHTYLESEKGCCNKVIHVYLASAPG